MCNATVSNMLGLDCTVYMGAVDCGRQRLNVFCMNKLGATVAPVQNGQRTLKDAINEAMRGWVTNVRDTHYLIGSVVGPHPFPTIVRDFKSVIGREMRAQMLEKIMRSWPAWMVDLTRWVHFLPSFKTTVWHSWVLRRLDTASTTTESIVPPSPRVHQAFCKGSPKLFKKSQDRLSTLTPSQQVWITPALARSMPT